eukprot:SAG31_NODE_540_length_14288_cov_51.958066_8_plen_306_part_00
MVASKGKAAKSGEWTRESIVEATVPDVIVEATAPDVADEPTALGANVEAKVPSSEEPAAVVSSYSAPFVPTSGRMKRKQISNQSDNTAAPEKEELHNDEQSIHLMDAEKVAAMPVSLSSLVPPSSPSSLVPHSPAPPLTNLSPMFSSHSDPGTVPRSGALVSSSTCTQLAPTSALKRGLLYRSVVKGPESNRDTEIEESFAKAARYAGSRADPNTPVTGHENRDKNRQNRAATKIQAHPLSLSPLQSQKQTQRLQCASVERKALTRHAAILVRDSKESAAEAANRMLASRRRRMAFGNPFAPTSK